MRQGPTGVPNTYARLKDPVMEPIPETDGEDAIAGDWDKWCWAYFFDNDYKAAATFEDLLMLLHEHYFPRIPWRKVTLEPRKCDFFMDRVQALGLEFRPK